MKKRYLQIVIIMMIFTGCALASFAQPSPYLKPRADLLRIIRRNLAVADQQYQLMGSQLTEGQFPKSYDEATAKLVTSNSGWWCSGFYPGTLLLEPLCIKSFTRFKLFRN